MKHKDYPVYKGQELEVTIEGYTSEGQGVARVEGLAVFVAGGLAGERLKIRIAHLGHTAAYGDILKILEKSPQRREPECPYSGSCGGCTFWHMSYEEELRAKAQRVSDALTRIGGLHLGEIPITGSPAVTGYRNKAQYPVGLVKGKPQAGFFRHLVQDRKQLAPDHRLEQVVKGLALQGRPGIVEVRIAAEHHGEALGPALLQLPQQLHAVHNRHPDIGNHQVRRILLHKLQGLGAVSHGSRHGAGRMLSHQLGHRLGNEALILYDQYLHPFHVPFNVTMVPCGSPGSMLQDTRSSVSSRRRVMVLTSPRPPICKSV